MAVKRGKTYTTRMRVPPRYRGIDTRAEVWIALRTDSPKEAKRREPQVRAAQLAKWEAELTGLVTPEQARTILADLGLPARSAEEIAAVETLAEITARIAHLDQDSSLPIDHIVSDINRVTAAAVLGGFEDGPVMLSGLLEHIEALPEVVKANRHKSDDQMRKWRNPRRRAIENLRAALTWKKRPDDLAVDEIAHQHARIHQAWWSERLKDGKLSIDTPNREYVTMSGMLTAYYDGAGKQSPKPYSGISHKDRYKEPTSKPEFSEEWIAANVITPGVLDRMNREERDITIILAETGCRQSEVYNTPPWDWHLDEPIPYFLIQPIDEDGEDPDFRREIKNIHSKRKVPLVGAALEAARRREGLFPQYGGKSTYSAAVNKWFRDNKMFPTKHHTIGGLRHSWESRMKAVGVDKEDRGELMGHSRKRTRGREVYGDALELELRHTIALLVAIHPSGSGHLVDGEEREVVAAKLVRLLKQWKEMGK